MAKKEYGQQYHTRVKGHACQNVAWTDGTMDNNNTKTPKRKVSSERGKKSYENKNEFTSTLWAREKREKIAGRKHFGWAKNLVGTFQWVQSGVGLRGGNRGRRAEMGMKRWRIQKENWNKTKLILRKKDDLRLSKKKSAKKTTNEYALIRMKNISVT